MAVARGPSCSLNPTQHPKRRADSGHSLRVQTELDDLSIAAIPSAKKIKIPLHRRKAASGWIPTLGARA